MSSSRLELADVAPDRAARLRVEADGRLVEEQHARRVQQAARDLQAPLHAAGERVDEARAALPQADHLHHLSHALARRPRAARRTARRAGAGSARPSGSRRASCPGRPGRCCAAPRRVRCTTSWPATRADPAARAHERAQHVDRRRLAGAVGAEEAEDLAGVHLEVDPAHRLDLVVALDEAVDRDGGASRSDERGGWVGESRGWGCRERPRHLRCLASSSTVAPSPSPSARIR